MAAATSIILAGTALASTGLGVAKSVKEAKQAREAKKNIDNYQRQEIDFNNYLMAVDTPTDQYVQQLKRVQQESANYSEQASSAGARGLSLLPGIQEQTYAQEEQLAANFQNQLYELQNNKPSWQPSKRAGNSKLGRTVNNGSLPVTVPCTRREDRVGTLE